MAYQEPLHWKASIDGDDNGGKVRDEHDNLIAIVCGAADESSAGYWQGLQARTRLIAASPNLLAACEGMLRHIDDVLDDDDLTKRRAALVAAIQEAKGQP